MTNLGGGSVGGAHFDIQARISGLEQVGGQFTALAERIKAIMSGAVSKESFDESGIIEQIKSINKALNDLKDATKEIIPSESTKEIEETLVALREALQAQLGVAKSTAQVAPAADAARKALQSYGRAQSAASKADRERTKDLQDFARLQKTGVPVTDATTKKIQAYGRVQAAAEKADAARNAQLRKFLQALGQFNRLQQAGVPVIDKATKSTQAYGKVQDQANQADLKRAKALAEQTRLLAAGVPVTDAATKKIQDYGKVQAKAAAENDKLTTKVGGFKGALNGLQETLGKVGLNISGISVLLGAGFAGGAAGVIKIATDLAVAFAQQVDAISRVERETDRAFGAAADDVRAFADEVADSTGRTRTEVLKAANSFAQFGRATGIARSDIAGFSTELASLAADLEKRIPSIHNIEEAVDLLTRALRGDVEALAELGFTLGEIRDLVKELFPGRTLDNLTEAEKRLLGVEVAARANANAAGELGVKTATLTDRLKQLGNAITRSLGVGADRAFNTAQKALHDLVTDTIFDLGRGGQELHAFTEQLKFLSTAQLESLREEADGHVKATAAIDKEIAAREKLQREKEKSLVTDKDLAQVQRENEEAFRNSTSAIQQAEDAIKARNRAIKEGNLREREAIIELERAREDATLREAQVRRENQRSLEDANRQIQDASIKVERAKEDRLRDIEKVEFDHRRKIEDLRRNHQRKVEDFAEAESDARRAEVRSTIEALIALQNAQFNFNTVQFNEAQRRLSQGKEDQRDNAEDRERDRLRELEDFRREVARAHEDRIRELHDIEIESTRELVDANRELEEALLERQRAFEDAVTRLHELEIENSRSLYDAQKRVEEAHREAQQAIKDSQTALDRLATQYSVTLDFIERIVVGHERWKDELTEIAGIENRRRQADREARGESPPGGFGGAGASGSWEPEAPAAKKTSTANRGASSGGNTIIVHEAADPEATAFAVEARMMRDVQR